MKTVSPILLHQLIRVFILLGPLACQPASDENLENHDSSPPVSEPVNQLDAAIPDVSTDNPMSNGKGPIDLGSGQGDDDLETGMIEFPTGPGPASTVDRPAPMRSESFPSQVDVLILLDGNPSPATTVLQGGTENRILTNGQGRATLALDKQLDGEIWVVASHPEARIMAAEVYEGVDEPIIIELTRFDPSDNPDYNFQDPGEPMRRGTTAQCGHCHLSINDAWFDSPHRTSAKNSKVLDLYSGVASALNDEMSCQEAGGTWAEGRKPGGDDTQYRCFIGDGVLPDLNPNCAEGNTCDDDATMHGYCADCHAPAIDGQLGGRDLLDARGIAFDYGISCNVCHQVESVVMDDEPGVAGRLRIVRPSQAGSITLGAGGLRPLLFGPSYDSPNPRMGNVQRDHYRDGSICAGCHQHHGAPLQPDVEVDLERWPDGKLPFQSTYEEWRTGPLGEATRCQSCHMPPDPAVSNGADLQAFPAAMVGVMGGWRRPPGAVRQHSWLGPRQPKSQLLQLAAALMVRKGVVKGQRFEVEVDVQNIGAGHALPTGEPMRSVLLRVSAFCDEERLEAVGGDAVPPFAGFEERKVRGDDWTHWPQAAVGDEIRVIGRTNEWHDYDGFGSFEVDGFEPAEKGMPVEEVIGVRTIIAIQNGRVQFDAPLPDGDIAFRISGQHAHRIQAGQAGFAFARVLADRQGLQMVPHHLAVDVVSDNRLKSQQRWTSHHVFEAHCDDPTVHGQLFYRAFPIALSEERRWDTEDVLMTEVRR